MQAPGELITLREGTEAKAVIAPDLGGWLLRYMRHLPIHGDVEALYFGQEVVDRYPNQMYAGNPLLFPQVSFTHSGGKDHHYEWQGRTYPLAQHGFARRSKWRVTAVNETAVTMELHDSPETQKVYPFTFRSTVTYRLDSGRLRFEQTVENTGKDALPFSTGIHPYFPVPIRPSATRNDCYVELPAGRIITPQGEWETWTAERFPKQRLPVANDVSGTVFLTDMVERKVCLVDPKSRIRITLDFRESPAHRFLAIWSKSTSDPFYCLEPWTALPNSFARKESELILLKSGDVFRAGMVLSVEQT